MSKPSTIRRGVLAAVAALTLAGFISLRPAEAAVDQAVVDGQVTRLYKAYFLRDPEPAGRAYWAGRMTAGMRLEDISQFFAGSTEFKNRYGSLSNGGFVDLVYENVLGRAPDPGGRAHWVSGLDAGRLQRGKVMVGFSESPEFVKKTGTTPPPTPTPPGSTTTTTTTRPSAGCATAGVYQAKNGVCVADYEDAGGDVDCGQLPSGAKPVQVPSGSSDPYDMDGDHDGIGCERG